MTYMFRCFYQLTIHVLCVVNSFITLLSFYIINGSRGWMKSKVHKSESYMLRYSLLLFIFVFHFLFQFIFFFFVNQLPWYFPRHWPILSWSWNVSMMCSIIKLWPNVWNIGLKPCDLGVILLSILFFSSDCLVALICQICNYW